MRITNLANIREAVSAELWAITPQKLDAIVEVLEIRTSDTPLTVEEVQARLGDNPKRSTQRSGAVAVIPLAGTLFPKANMVTESSGGVSVERWISQVEAAMADDSISAVVLDIDSPGGAVSGIPEAAARLRALRGKGKPIVAVANTLMASGAYWLGAQADSIVASPSADVGSVGVFTVHRDLSKAYADKGIVHTLIKAGQYKAEGVPFEPLSDEAKASLQAKVDEVYDDFVSALAKGRGTTAAAVKAGFGEGRVLSARNALKAGMIDAVGTLQTVVSDLVQGRSAKYLRADDVTPLLVAEDSASELVALESYDPPRAGALVLVKPSSNLAPPVAEEHPVEPTTTATPVASATPTREAQLAELAALTNRPNDLMGWITSGKTVSAVQDEIKASFNAPAPVTVTVGTQRETLKPWETLGHFASAVAVAATPGVRSSEMDPRLFASATGLNQASPTDGGFAVPGQFNNSLWEGLFNDASSLLSMTDNYDIDGEFIEMLAVDDTTRATGTVFGGATAKWLNEGGQIDSSAPKFRKMRLEPQELAGMAYATEKLLNNSPVALGQFLGRALRGAISLKVNEALINGDGVGKPKGLLNSACKITQTKASSQANGTIITQNIADMKSRRIASVANQYVWLYNTDCETQLSMLSTTVKNVAGTENVGGFSNNLWDSNTNRLGGLQAIPNDHCAALGTESDLMLVYLPAYAVGLRRAGVKTAESMHLRFDYAEKAFRAMFDIDGQSWLNSALTPAKGSTKSTIITLQTR